MRRTGKSKTCVWRWQERFAQEGYDTAARQDTAIAHPAARPEVSERVVALTLSDPPAEATHWVAAMMAKATGISVSSVLASGAHTGFGRIGCGTFKLSNDPDFVAKLRDVVGLYVDPPAHAIVLSVDEKSQIQALDRTQPGLPMKKRRLGTMTHDYKRHAHDHPVRRPQRARGRSSGAACSATATRSSSASSTPSRPISRPARASM